MKIVEITTKQEEFDYIVELISVNRPGQNWGMLLELLDATAGPKLIKESLTNYDINSLEELQSFGVYPMIGKRYIPLSCFFMNDKIVYSGLQYGGLTFMTFVGKNGDRFEMKDENGTILFFPDERMSKVAYIATIFFETPEQYSRAETWSLLKFNTRLPELEDSVTENLHYLGPTEKVKINKGGWQIPLNKKGFGA